MTQAERIGKNIKQLREENCMDQCELSKKLGMTQKAVSAWETGRACPRMATIEQITKIFNCETGDIIYGKNLKERLEKYTSVASIPPLLPKLENTDEQRLINIFHKLPEDKQRELLNYAIDLLTQ